MTPTTTGGPVQQTTAGPAQITSSRSFNLGTTSLGQGGSGGQAGGAGGSGSIPTVVNVGPNGGTSSTSVKPSHVTTNSPNAALPTAVLVGWELIGGALALLNLM
jgi:hypothetical protein